MKPTHILKLVICIELLLCATIVFLFLSTYISMVSVGRISCDAATRKSVHIECKKPSTMPVVVIDPGQKVPVKYVTHLLKIFNRLGYRHEHVPNIKKSNTVFDLVWTQGYPRQLLLTYHKINHFPGIGWIGAKAILSREGGKYIPQAFLLPEDRDKFLTEVHNTTNTNRTWVRKNTNHRGVQVVDTKALNLDSKMLIQEYVPNPFLIDGYKFNMGVYVVLTSINPLRAYILESTLGVRFCSGKYKHGNYTDITTYNTDIDDHKSAHEIPKIDEMLKRFAYKRNKLLELRFQETGVNPSYVKEQIYEAVRDILITREARLDEKLASLIPKDRRNLKLYGMFFEIMRWDFLIDENLRVHLIEANMSPDLVPMNEKMIVFKQHVAFNCFNVALLNDVKKHGSVSSLLRSIRDSDINDHISICVSSKCNGCNEEGCSVCTHCMSRDAIYMLKLAYAEHINRQNMRRVYPEETTMEAAMSYNAEEDSHMSPNNRLTRAWFRAKCVADPYWCS
ncbi:probable tubulin polyglutamylase ttll-15 [Amphiura filiformis]|uniref:probable tubulin polyglutamylase ttll-15 n=1 Tax=Amphiura filiformis TaxID=82378 RepID=UPI003B21C97C